MPDQDVQLEQKKRARRRLVGAAALALFAAIVLPLVMDSEPRQDDPELQIRIPSQEGGNYTARQIPDKSAAGQASPVVPPPAPKVPAKTDVEPPQPQPLPMPPPAQPSSAAQPVTAKPSSVKPPEEKSPLSEAERARSILEGGGARGSNTAAYLVQLGAYRDAANAAKVQARAKAEGYNAYVEPLGDKVRVRAGPFSSREAADAAAAKLTRQGLTASVVAR